MLVHLIPHKGKGMMVWILPLVLGIVLFIIADAFNINEQYILPAALLLSSLFIWFFDDGPKIIRDGINNTPKSKHTLFWIEIKYWAIVLGITGCIILNNLWEKQ